MRLPDFLLIGAARSGTTALHSYLRQCPDVFMPTNKEPNFFAFDGTRPDFRGPGADFLNNSVTDLGAYAALFEDAPRDAILGEASPLYLFSERAPGRIRHHVPDVRMIAVLRNPVEQAFSHFQYAQKWRIEPLDDFVAALGAEEERLAAGWQYLFGYSRFPRYGEQLERYFALFPRERFLIRTYDEFCDDPAGVFSEMLAFIGADPGFRPDMSRRPNPGGKARSGAVQDFLMRPGPAVAAVARLLPERLRRAVRDRISEMNLVREERMSEQARAILVERLADDVARLGRLLGRDFGHWLRPPAGEALRP